MLEIQLVEILKIFLVSEDNESLVNLFKSSDEIEKNEIINLYIYFGNSIEYIKLHMEYLSNNYENSNEWSDKDHSGPSDTANEFAESNLPKDRWYHKHNI